MSYNKKNHNTRKLGLTIKTSQWILIDLYMKYLQKQSHHSERVYANSTKTLALPMHKDLVQTSKPSHFFDRHSDRLSHLESISSQPVLLMKFYNYI